MLHQISKHLKQVISTFQESDQIILNNQNFAIDSNNFQPIIPKSVAKTITFIDGGQAEILQTGNFCLSLIRVAAVTLSDNKKSNQIIKEFYIFTQAVYQNNEIFYQSKLFSNQELLISEQDLFISSNDPTIKTGLERAPIQKIATLARRLAELALANKTHSDFIILDGTLEKTFTNEEKYLAKLPVNTSAIAKTSSLFTTSGNSPLVLINKLSPLKIWSYSATERISFVKLHSSAKHFFRFEGNKEVLPCLIEQSTDALFLGYPYGLILADKLARVSEQERKSLKMQFLLRSENKVIAEYLQNTNAHEILDRLQY